MTDDLNLHAGETAYLYWTDPQICSKPWLLLYDNHGCLTELCRGNPEELVRKAEIESGVFFPAW